MRYLNQLEYPHWLYVTQTDMDEEHKEKGRTTTIRSSGCGLCSAIMVVDRLLPNADFGLTEAITLAYESKSNADFGTEYKIFALAFAEKMGFRLEMTNDNERLRHCLRTGGAAVLNVGGNYEGHIGVFSSGGHFVVAINEEPDGRIAVLDPSYKPGKYEVAGRQGKVEIKNEIIALCDMYVLEEDTANRDPGYYLFWRS